MSVKETKDKVNGPLWVCILFWVLGAIWHFLAFGTGELVYVIISTLFGSAFFIVGALAFLAWYYVNK